ncbi:30590_t:CDS:2, partial [Gigaspora margarita]
TSCDQSIIQPTFNADYQSYNGSFASDIQMDDSSVIRFNLYFTSTEDSINLTRPVYMSVMDPGYGPNTVQYNSSISPYNEPFVQSIELKNIYHLSQNSVIVYINYIVRFFKKIRYMVSSSDFGPYLGIKPRYYPIPYVESIIEPITYKTNLSEDNWYASVAFTPATTIIEQEAEQRFNPWGYVQKKLIYNEGLIYTADTLVGSENFSSEERFLRLEALDMFLNDHVIDIPFDRNIKR